MKRRLAVSFLVFAALAIGARAYAHHSFAATYREKDSVTIEGELVQLDFRNPHSFVHVMVKEKDGSMVRYAIEGMLPKNKLRARRLKKLRVYRDAAGLARHKGQNPQPLAI